MRPKPLSMFLARMPEMGTLCRLRDPKVGDIRMWSIRGFKNYVIFYRSLKDGIDVVRIIHGARDLQAIFTDDQIFPDDRAD